MRYQSDVNKNSEQQFIKWFAKRMALSGGDHCMCLIQSQCMLVKVEVATVTGLTDLWIDVLKALP